jgi:hypothetical protein
VIDPGGDDEVDSGGGGGDPDGGGGGDDPDSGGGGGDPDSGGGGLTSRCTTASLYAGNPMYRGDATPIHVTIPLEQPWVPLRILGLGLPSEAVVAADVFLLTDDRPSLLYGGDGLRVNRSEQAAQALMGDLRSDRGMEWMPPEMWLTHLALEDDAGTLDYDLSVGAGTKRPSRVAAGLASASGHSLASERTSTNTDRQWAALTAGDVRPSVCFGLTAPLRRDQVAG